MCFLWKLHTNRNTLVTASVLSLKNVRQCHDSQLIFGRDFNKPIAGAGWPPGMTTLRFGRSFDRDVEDVGWPTSLRMLSLGWEFQHPLGTVGWPGTLEELSLSCRKLPRLRSITLPPR